MPNITHELYQGLFNESDVVYAERAVIVRGLSRPLSFAVIARSGEAYSFEHDGDSSFVPPNQVCAEIRHEKSFTLGVLWEDMKEQRESALKRLEFRALAALLQPSQSHLPTLLKHARKEPQR